MPDAYDPKEFSILTRLTSDDDWPYTLRQFLKKIKSSSFPPQLMPLTLEQKKEIVGQYRQAENDTGSPEVQVALLTTRIGALTSHFSKHKGDHHSRQGLLKMVSTRRKLLKYLKSRQLSRYKDLISSLGLRA